MEALEPLVEKYELLHEVRGLGLMIGLVFGSSGSRGSRARFAMMELARKGLFSQLIVVPLFHRHRILTQVAADNVNIVKLLPPLIIGDEEIDSFVTALDDVLADAHRSSGLLVEVGATMARQQPAPPPPGCRRQSIGPPVTGTEGGVAVAAGDRVLVTGGAGFIGSSVVRHLGSTGAHVVVMVEPGGDTANLEGVDAEVVFTDVRDGVGVAKAVDGCRVVFHVAALYRFWARDPHDFYDINVAGTTHVLQAARRSGCERVVYTSTVGTLGLQGASAGEPVGRDLVRSTSAICSAGTNSPNTWPSTRSCVPPPRVCPSSWCSRRPRSGRGTVLRPRRAGPCWSS